MTAIFYGCIRDGLLVLNERHLLRDAFRSWPNGPVEVEIRPRRSRRSLAQSAGFHAMLTPWARDEGHNIDDLKRDLLREVFGTVERPNAVTGAVELDLAEPHTSGLDVAQFSQLIERTLEIAARCGYVLIAPSEWRERETPA